MNYAPVILDQFAKQPDLREVVLVPSAPLVIRRNGGLEPLTGDVISASDIRDTLIVMRGHSSATSMPLQKQGVFSIGQPNIGRLRVSFMTQRGSLVARMLRVPFTLPPLAELLQDPAQVALVDQLFLTSRGGLLMVAGPAEERNRLLVYTALQRVNQQMGRIMYILEPTLSYLLQHDRSVIFQSELDSDVESIAQGIQAALQIAPDVIFAAGVVTHEDTLALLKAAETGVLAVATCEAADQAEFLQQIQRAFHSRYADFVNLPRTLLKVRPTSSDKVAVDVTSLG